MNKAWTSFKRQFEENPLAVVFVATMAASVATKLLHEVVAARNSKTYALEVNRRMMNVR